MRKEDEELGRIMEIQPMLIIKSRWLANKLLCRSCNSRLRMRTVFCKTWNQN
jgi:hypothetical protein